MGLKGYRLMGYVSTLFNVQSPTTGAVGFFLATASSRSW
jgi:hypothetical protein